MNSLKVVSLYTAFFLFSTLLFSQLFQLPMKQFRLLGIILEYSLKSDIIYALSLSTMVACIATTLTSKQIFNLNYGIKFDLLKKVSATRIISYTVLPFVLILICFLLIVFFETSSQVTFNGDFRVNFDLIFFLLISAVSEELIFRLILLKVIFQSTRNWRISIVISSMLFSIFHIANGLTIVSFINIFFAGILLSLIVVRNRFLLYSILFHFFWNSFQGVFFGFKISGLSIPSALNLEFRENNLFNGGDFGLEGSWLATTILCGFTIFYYHFFKRLNLK